LSDEEVAEGLRNKGFTEEKQLQETVYLADGDFNQALKLMDQQKNDNATILLDWLRKCYGGKGIELNSWVEGIAKIGRESQKHFLQYGLHFMREFLVLKMTGQSVVRLQTGELETAQRMLKVMNFEQVEKITKIMDHCYFAVERNAHPKILFLDASIKINQILKSKITTIGCLPWNTKILQHMVYSKSALNKGQEKGFFTIHRTYMRSQGIWWS